MSENKTVIPETQKERWVKYGANVAIASVVVVLLAAAATWLAQDFNRRVDTTSAGLYSLKPQTVNIIKNNKSDIKIISLYTRTKPNVSYSSEEMGQLPDFAQPVADLLDEYKRKGSKIDVEVVDPLEQPTKVDQLIREVTEKYGGEVQKYKAVCEEYPKTYEQIAKMAGEEAKKVQAALPEQIDANEDLGQTLFLTIATVQGFPKFLENTKESIEKRLKQKPPDYKGAVNSIEQGMNTLSQLAARIVDDFVKSKDDAKVPQKIRTYMAESVPRYEQIKKLADDLAKRIKDLGELKLDTLRQSLRERDAILVMGQKEMRVISFEKVWQVPDDARGYTPDGKPRPRFAGEQQITSAILSLTAPSKPKVVFLRPGGGPLAQPGIPGFRPGGPLSQIAMRLADYNFEVLEKDISGMWAMQSQMQGMPAAPEPSDEQIKDAIWVVLDLPAPPQRSPMGPPPSIAPKLAAHLKEGGSAVILALPQAEPLAAALDEWGVKIRTDAIAVHEPVKSAPGGRANDFIEEVQRNPMIFLLRDYGDHPLAKPLKSLEGVLVPMCVVEAWEKPGYKMSRLVPVPQTLKSWGETNIEAALRGGGVVEYNAPKGASLDGDLPPPLFAGVAVEKDKAGRIVVFGSVQFILNDMLSFSDPTLAKQGIIVSRFPANGELFMNSVFWLAKMDPMLAISPSAMEVSRIAEMSPAVLNTWRIGVLLIVLPGLVIVAGMLVYVARRD
ncbi:MAG: Gldg family protein [Planctomycetota bacterium]|nr:Gldg family protein [Planctomycetota bacterium]